MHDSHADHSAPYFIVFMALIVCTFLSIVADVFQPDSKLALIVIVLAIATAKALFVLVYFMHLKFEGRWKYVLLAPTTILACGLPLALLPDIGMHYYADVTPNYQVQPTNVSDHAQEDAPEAAGGHDHE